MTKSPRTKPQKAPAVIETVAEQGLSQEQQAALDEHVERTGGNSTGLDLDDPHPAREEMLTADEHVASEPVELASEAPEPAPTEIGDQLAKDTDAATMARVEIWLSDTRYFISTLEHQVKGGAGEIIEYLKARL